jgi:hypothetical protein
VDCKEPLEIGDYWDSRAERDSRDPLDRLDTPERLVSLGQLAQPGPPDHRVLVDLLANGVSPEIPEELEPRDSRDPRATVDLLDQQDLSEILEKLGRLESLVLRELEFQDHPDHLALLDSPELLDHQVSRDLKVRPEQQVTKESLG